MNVIDIKYLADQINLKTFNKFKTIVKDETIVAGKKIQTEVKKVYANSRLYGIKGLADSTKKRKKMNKTRPLIETARLLRSISVSKIKESNQTQTDASFELMVYPQGMHYRGKKNKDIAEIHERGTSTIPARKVWGVVKQQKLPKIINETIIRIAKKIK